MYKAMFKGVSINILSEKYANQRDWLKAEKNKDLFLCPICGGSVTLHWAMPARRTPHFKHKHLTNCIYEQHGEGQEHLEGKKQLYYYFVKLLSHKAKSIELEEYIPETGQIADILIEFYNGKKWAIEYQRSNIPTAEILKRKELYSNANIRDIWIVGENVIKEIGLSTCSISNVGQALLHPFCGETSLISFEPHSNQVNIFRGLNSLNNRTYTFNKHYLYSLESIGFNLWGEIFCLDDYLELKNRVTNNDYIDISLQFPFVIKDVYKSEIPGFNFKFRTSYIYKEVIDSENIPEFTHIKIASPLNRIVPVEMKSIILFGFFLYDHKDPAERDQLIITGLIRSLWEKDLNKKTRNNLNNSQNFMDNIVVQGYFIWALQDIYENKFQTEKEFEKDLEYSNMARPIPFSLRNNRFKKHRMISKEFVKEDNNKIIRLEDCLLILLKIAKFHVDSMNILDVALENQIMLPNELESDFTIKTLDNIVKRIKKIIPESEHYHGFWKEGVGVFQ